MDAKTLAIVIAFILLFGLLLWLIISVQGKWWLKILAIIGALSFCLVVWNSLGSYLGWPAPSEIADAKARGLRAIPVTVQYDPPR